MLLILIFIIANIASSDEYYRVYYKDKDTLNFVEGNEYYNKTMDLFNQKSLERRVLHEKTITIEDAIITPKYIEEISKNDIKIINSSRWFNYTLIETKIEEAAKIANLSFVKYVYQTNKQFKTQNIENQNYTNMILDKNEYGGGDTQVKMLNVDKFHSMGFNGDSVIVGYLDSGFYLNFGVFDSTQYLGEYDFVQNDSVTSNQDGDAVNQDLHGTTVLSVVSGYYNEKLIGIASESKYLLAKTEKIDTETNIEEDAFLFGLEWLEANGVEVVNSSLGYIDFDEDEFNYNYDDLDGSTTLVSNAVNKAVDKGILFFNSAGNNGGSEKTLISPSDADSVICVGGLEANGTTIWGGSSKGPNAKGDIRPHILAQSVKVTTALNSSTITFNKYNGTSYASPLMAGVGALIKSIYDIPNYEIKKYLITNADNYTTPSNTYGYGKADVEKTINELSEIYGPAISPYNSYEMNGVTRVVFYVYSKDEDIEVSLLTKKDIASPIKSKKMRRGEEAYQYYLDIEESAFNSNEILINLEVKYKNEIKYYKEEFVKIIFGNEIIRKGVDKFALPTLVEINQEDIIISVAQNEVQIENNSKKVGNFEINILDITGKVLILNSISLRNGKNVLKIENSLATGMYLVILKNESSYLLKKILIINKG
jgi:hypothetical protein